MGLVYSSSESSKLIAGMKNNLSIGKQVTEQLKTGSIKVVSAVDGKTLAGAAYTAGKGLFSELIIPTIDKVTSSMDKVEAELEAYINANARISDESLLDEDKLTKQIQTKQSMKNTVDSAASTLKNIVRNSLLASAVDSILSVQKTLNQLSEAFGDDIHELEKKLEKLHQFSWDISPLFSTSLNDMNIAMQAVLVLKNTTVNSDGTYQLPEGTDLSWFNSLKEIDDVEEMEDNALKAAIKDFNELYTKNPAMAIERVKNNKRLFSYLIGVLDKLPVGAQDAVLNLFIAQESWNKLPKDLALKILNSQKFAALMNSKSVEVQASVYGALIKLSDKGWDVIAPLGHVTNILSKSSVGEKIIAGSRIGFNKFKKLGKVAEFISKYKLAAEAAGIGGDAFILSNLAYKEYINPDSPAYGDASKALYGGISLFFYVAGPLEGAQYGGPVGALAGTVNTLVQGNLTVWPDELFGFDLPGNEIKTPGIGSEEAKKKWLDEQYKNYGKHDAVSTDQNYKPGVQPQSGSGNFNPGTEYKPNNN